MNHQNQVTNPEQQNRVALAIHIFTDFSITCRVMYGIQPTTELVTFLRDLWDKGWSVRDMICAMPPIVHDIRDRKAEPKEIVQLIKENIEKAPDFINNCPLLDPDDVLSLWRVYVSLDDPASFDWTLASRWVTVHENPASIN